MSARKAQVIAVTPGGDITVDHIIGFYALFNVPDAPVPAAKAHRLWVAEGLPPHLIRNAREAKHAFMSACKSIETRRRPEKGSANTDRMTEVKAAMVVESERYVIYQITHHVRDPAAGVINHPKQMRVAYDKWDEFIEWEPLNKRLNQDTLDDLGHAIQRHFDQNQTKIPGPRIRSAIRGLMEDLDGVNVRRKAGGVYFVPKEGMSDLEALGRILGELYPEREGELHLIPCANAAGEREMIERHFSVNVTTEVDELMAEVTEALTDTNERRMRKDRVNNILQRRQQLAQHRERYKALLSTELEEVGEKVGLLDEQLTHLITKYGGE
jgi:hypothetical protein